MGQDYHDFDPRGLIREAYRIEGISVGEVRAIFLDWALTRPETPDEKVQIEALLGAYGADERDHPMSVVLRDGLEAGPPATGRRRGGSRGRRG